MGRKGITRKDSEGDVGEGGFLHERMDYAGAKVSVREDVNRLLWWKRRTLRPYITDKL